MVSSHKEHVSHLQLQQKHLWVGVIIIFMHLKWNQILHLSYWNICWSYASGKRHVQWGGMSICFRLHVAVFFAVPHSWGKVVVSLSFERQLMRCPYIYSCPKCSFCTSSPSSSMGSKFNGKCSTVNAAVLASFWPSIHHQPQTAIVQ